MELILLIGGVLLAAAAVVFRKKLTTAWMISLISAGVIIGIFGGVTVGIALNGMREDDRNVHIALRYLEAGQPEEAVHYLKKVKKDSFESVAAEALAEKCRGNDMLSKIKLDALESKISNDTEKTICLSLNAVSGDDYAGREAAVTMIHNALAISEGQQKKADTQYVMESGNYVEGIEIDYSTMSEEERLRMNISNTGRYGSSYEALQNAAVLLEMAPSAENRLLFAELIADMIYSGQNLADMRLFSDERVNEKLGRALGKMKTQLDELVLSEQGLKIKIESVSDEAQKDQLSEELADLTERIEVLRREHDYLYAHRALNSIADLFSLDAAVVRARLHFAMRDYDKAVKCLGRAASNPMIRLFADGDLKNALNVLDISMKKQDAVGTQSAEFKDAIKTIVSYTGSNLIGTRTSMLTLDFTDYIMTNQKDYGSDLYITSLDTSAFPEISITVSGRDTVIDELVSSGGHTVRDTRSDVKYKISRIDYENEKMDICCVVDESGSMGGYPTQDLKTALSGFIGALDKKTRIGIVGFESSYEILCPMSDNHAVAAAAVSNIRADGGTDITSGIQGAMASLADSPNRKTVLLMTDGQSDVDMSVVSQAAEMGCVIHCIGFGDVNDNILQSIADMTGGQYIRAENSSELINVYLDLVGMIGNEVRITYTVHDEVIGNGSRYFFLQTSKSAASVKYYYVLGVQKQPVISYVDNPLIADYEIEDAKSSGQTLSVSIHGYHFSDVREITIGNQTVKLFDDDGNYTEYLDDISDTYIRISIQPTLIGGWQKIVLKDADGNTYEFSNMCCVGTNVDVYGPITFGDVTIDYFHRACMMSDGTIVFANPWLHDDAGFSAEARGLLYTTVDRALFEEDTSFDIAKGYSIPKAAGLKGAGSLVITGDDFAYNYQVSETLACGNYQMIYNADELRVAQQ